MITISAAAAASNDTVSGLELPLRWPSSTGYAAARNKLANARATLAARLGALRRAVQGISQKMLTQNLRPLERDGLELRRLLSDRPIQVEYSLLSAALRLRQS